MTICEKAGLPFIVFNMTITAAEKRKLMKLSMESPSKFSETHNIILTTPDSFIGEDLRFIFSNLYKNKKLKKFIVDEAHLVFDQGLGFRPNYLKMLSYFETLRDTQFIFCSGSLPDITIEKIIKISRLPPPHTLIRRI